MRVICCGSRGWTDRGRISDRLALLDPEGCVIVVGYDPEKDRPKGADRLAYQEAQKLGLLVEPHPADWDHLGKGAGLVRNEEMAQLGADLCIAFWDSRSTGTYDMIQRAIRRGIEVEIHDKDSKLVIGPTSYFVLRPRPDFDPHLDYPERYKQGPI
jgi:hypothetical protein